MQRLGVESDCKHGIIWPHCGSVEAERDQGVGGHQSFCLRSCMSE